MRGAAADGDFGAGTAGGDAGEDDPQAEHEDHGQDAEEWSMEAGFGGGAEFDARIGAGIGGDEQPQAEPCEPAVNRFVHSPLSRAGCSWGYKGEDSPCGGRGKSEVEEGAVVEGIWEIS
jgi:hypothetical protein